MVEPRRGLKEKEEKWAFTFSKGLSKFSSMKEKDNFALEIYGSLILVRKVKFKFQVLYKS